MPKNKRTMPNRTEADSKANERNTMDDNRSAASSVELVEEVTNIASEPITQIPESDENAVSDSPLTPLARGFIPPNISAERRQKKRITHLVMNPQKKKRRPRAGTHP